MLRELRIRNFAIVEDADLELKKGMTAFTGETGAGKSLLLDAITVLLGAKARGELVRSGAKSAEVEGVFDLSKDLAKRTLASELGFEIDADDGFRLIVRREIAANDPSRNRIWIQGRSVTRAQLQALLGDWVEVSGQHEFLKLNREDFVLALIDQYGGLKEEARAFGGSYSQLLALRKELEALETFEGNREARTDFLRYQMEELEKAGISAESHTEEEKLNALRSRLGNLGKIRNALDVATLCLEGTEGDDQATGTRGIVSLFQTMARELRPFQTLDEGFAKLLSGLEMAETSVLELRETIREILISLEADPEALELAESRLSLMNRLKRKYHRDLPGLFDLLGESRRELEGLAGGDARRDRTREEVRTREEKLFKQARTLHGRREDAASTLTGKWQKDLAFLGMKNARLQLALSLLVELSPRGLTKVEALFSANPGETLKSISKVASGGELSRILLSLKHIISGRSEVGVYLFDEVDAGIGGETAHAVGERLRRIAEDNQVLVVTHLAQVAAKAHEQIRIEKRSEKGRVTTVAERLTAVEREKEVARMLGATGSQAALKLARELLRENLA